MSDILATEIFTSVFCVRVSEKRRERVGSGAAGAAGAGWGATVAETYSPDCDE